jgi:hypothetical protein
MISTVKKEGDEDEIALLYIRVKYIWGSEGHLLRRR